MMEMSQTSSLQDTYLQCFVALRGVMLFDPLKKVFPISFPSYPFLPLPTSRKLVNIYTLQKNPRLQFFLNMEIDLVIYSSLISIKTKISY